MSPRALLMVIDAVFDAELLPRRMWSDEAEAMLLAIALQESRIQQRIQLIGSARQWWESPNGPARGYFQFEIIGVRGVLEHHASRTHAEAACKALDYRPDPEIVYQAIAHNDLLAVCFARLALWRLPAPLPDCRNDEDEAWRQYIEAWRPGKPRRDTWGELYALAWDTVLS